MTSWARDAELTTLETSDDERQRARLVVCAQASSADEAGDLLDMLGLIPSAPPPPKPLRTARRVTLSPQDVDTIRRRWTSDEVPTQRQLATEFGVTVMTISRIVRGVAWASGRAPRPGPPFAASRVRVQSQATSHTVICQVCGPVDDPAANREAAKTIRTIHLRRHRQPGPALTGPTAT